MEQSLIELMVQYKNFQREDDFVKILKQFQPLIRKYAKQLYYIELEDSIQELSLSVFEALQNVDYLDNEFACISYLKKAIYHRFCKLYATSEKEQSKRDKSMPYEDLIVSSNDSSMKDRLFLLDLRKLINTMCYPKKDILILLLKGYTDKDIGNKLHCSRQYVNRIKKSIITDTDLLKYHKKN